MSEAGDCGQMPQPGPEHEWIQGSAGTWNVKCTYWMDPSQPPMEATAVETIDTVGPFWTVSTFESNFMGMPFKGRSTLGYTPAKERFVGTWIDSMSQHMFVMEGTRDDSGNVLEMTCEGPDMMTGQIVTYRTREERTGSDGRNFQMFVQRPEQGEQKMFEYEYTRA